MSRQDEWTAYYDRFAYFSPGVVRDGCQPRILEHSKPGGRAIVLVHGLTDSPYFVAAIGEHFHRVLGHDVYMPLLHAHGLKEPRGMEDVELDEWKANVRFAIDVAAERAKRVSIGGLSTGGALSFYMACTKPKVTGDLYLFSGALDLAGGRTGLIGELMEILSRTFLADLLDPLTSNVPLIGANPYRYARIDTDGARQLALLLKETDDLLEGFGRAYPFPKRVFAAHSESDSTASIAGAKALQRRTRPDDFCPYYIAATEGVSHASVVLEEPVCSLEDGSVLEPANSLFADMLRAVDEFERAG